MKSEDSGAATGTLLAVTAVMAAFLCLFMPDTVSEATSRALALCARRVIPSVFPFSVLSTLFVASGGGRALDSAAAPLCRRLFGTEHGIAALLQGMFFGFPLGALTVGSAFRSGEISSDEAARLLAFVSCASPTFPVFVVGVGYFGSLRAGLALFGVQAAVSVLIGMLLPRGGKSVPKPPAVPAQPKVTGVMPLFTQAITGASRVMLNVCGSVTFFSVASAVVERLLSAVTSSPLPALFVSAAFEFSSGTAAAHDAFLSGEISRNAAFALCGFSIGSAGLSVLFQTASVCEGISLIPHIAGKLTTGALTSAAMYALSFLPSFKAEAAGAFSQADAASAAAASFAVLALAAVLIFLFPSVKKGVAKRRRTLYNIGINSKDKIHR